MTPAVQDMLLVPYDRTGATRYSPITFNNGGKDEAFSTIMLGAGLNLFTGTSFATGADQDIYTVAELNDTVNSVTPASYTIAHVLSGSTSNLVSVDSSFLDATADSFTTTSMSQQSTFYLHVDRTDYTPTEMTVSVTGKAVEANVWQKVEIYDYIQGAWVTISDRPTPTTADQTLVPLKFDPNQYIGTYIDSGMTSHPDYVQLRVIYYGNSDTGYSEPDNVIPWVAFDQVRVDTIGY